MLGTSPLHTSPPRFRTRLGQSLASPASVLVVVPLLVVGVGAFMAVSGQSSLRASIDTMAEARFADQTAYASRHIRDTLGQAGPLLDSFRAFLRERDGAPTAEETARFLMTLMDGRSGVSFASFGRRDGRFLGVFLDDASRFWLSEREVTASGRSTLRDSRIPSIGPPILDREDPDYGYDVRTRPFYALARERLRRTWTEPYVFYDSGVPGVTCAEPLIDAHGDLQGVLSVDFNLNDLSEFVAGLDTGAGGRVFVFTADQALIALPGVQREFGQDQAGAGELLRAAQLDDPVLRAFFEQLPEIAPGEAGDHPFSYTAADEDYLASVAPCELDEMTWFVGAMAPRSAFMAPARAHRVRAVRIAGGALVVALAVAAVFAVNLVRSRREVAMARAAARAARKEVRELGSYRLLKPIGEGGMGEVWLAEHRLLARPAAIKLIHGEAIAEMPKGKVPQLLASFEREARVTASLSSPYTVRLFDYGVSRDGVFFFVMELLDGLDLQSLVEHWGPQPVGRVVHLLKQICSSLAEAHDKKLVHLDIKPANVFLCRQGDEADVVKVLDFGLARIHEAPREGEEPDRDEMIAGTPAYMAPERGMGRPDVDGRADIYSVGCVAYFLLAGSTVFDTESPTVMLRHHVETAPLPPGLATGRPLPPQLDALVMRCLAKDRAERPQDARELRALLDELPVPGGQEWTSAEIRDWWMAFEAHSSQLVAAPTEPGGRRLERGNTEILLDTEELDRADDDVVRTVEIKPDKGDGRPT
jgi:serine/threonine protein kinase